MVDSSKYYAGFCRGDHLAVYPGLDCILFAVTLTSGTGNEPITVALSNLAGGRAVQWNLPMAGAIMAALSTLIVYLILGRYFILGLLAGSVKG